jgi:hypothetical protein
MPLYFFSFLRSNGSISDDDEGTDFGGLDEAVAAAMASARETLADDIKFACENAFASVTVTNQNGDELKRITAREILPASLR